MDLNFEINNIYVSEREEGEKYKEYRRVLREYKKTRPQKSFWQRKKNLLHCIPVIGSLIVAISNLIKA